MAQSVNSGYLIKLTLVATLGGLLFGYDTDENIFQFNIGFALHF